jgi:exonuclease VII small subunit
MEEKILTVRDQLAGVTAEMDQTQALIDEARVKFQNDNAFQLTLDRCQTELDLKRQRVEIMRTIDSWLDRQE